MCRAALHMLDGGLPGADQPLLQGQPGPQSQPVGQGVLLPCVFCCSIATLKCIARVRGIKNMLGCIDAAEACCLKQQGVPCACIAWQARRPAWMSRPCEVYDGQIVLYQVYDVSAEHGEGPNFELLDATEYWEVPIEGGPPPNNPVPGASGARYSPPAGAAAAAPADADADLFTENGGGFGGPQENGHVTPVCLHLMTSCLLMLRGCPLAESMRHAHNTWTYLASVGVGSDLQVLFSAM